MNYRGDIPKSNGVDSLLGRMAEPRGFSWLSEQSIANRIMFQANYGFMSSQRWPGWLEGRLRNGQRMATPLDLSKSPSLATIQAVLEEGWMAGPFRDKQAQRLLKRLGSAYASSHSRDQSDYVYVSEDIAAMSGPGRAKARQYCRRLRADAAIRIESFTPDQAPAAQRVLEKWAARRPDDEDNDVQAAHVALELSERRMLQGVSVTKSGDLIGFLLADTNIQGVITALILKTSSPMQGLTDLCFQELCRLHPSKRWLNTCQDLGIAGLRKRKLGMGPAATIDKHYLFSVKRMEIATA